MMMTMREKERERGVCGVVIYLEKMKKADLPCVERF